MKNIWSVCVVCISITCINAAKLRKNDLSSKQPTINTLEDFSPSLLLSPFHGGVYESEEFTDEDHLLKVSGAKKPITLVKPQPKPDMFKNKGRSSKTGPNENKPFKPVSAALPATGANAPAQLNVQQPKVNSGPITDERSLKVEQGIRQSINQQRLSEAVEKMARKTDNSAIANLSNLIESASADELFDDEVAASPSRSSAGPSQMDKIILPRLDVPKGPVIAPGSVIATGAINPGLVIFDANNKAIQPASDSLKSEQEKENIRPGTVIAVSPFEVGANLHAPTQPYRKVQFLDELLISNIPVDPAYGGPQISVASPVTIEFVQKTLIPYFKSGKLLDRKSAYSLFFRATQEFMTEDNLQEIQLGQGEKIVVVGDIHGQFPDFIQILDLEGMPSFKVKYLFNGDVVDRGAYSVECLLTLLALKVAEPDNFFITLGNHETASVGRLQFFKETVKKYGSDEFFRLAHAVFRSLPVAYLIQGEVFVTHGGVTEYLSLNLIQQIDRFNPLSNDESVINDLIWSDPTEKEGTFTSPRGLGYLFGPDITKKFIQANNISLIIRSHQFKEFGFSEQHDGLCVTIFSCPNYRNRSKNLGAYIKLDHDLNLSYHVFQAAVDAGKAIQALPTDLKMARNIRRVR